MSSKKVRVLFDANSLVSNHKSGVGYYTEGLIQSLAEHYPDTIELTGYYHNFLGRKHPTFAIDLPNVRFKPIRYFPGFILGPLARKFGIQLPIELLVFRKYDLHLFPNFISLPSLRKTPSIITVHDLYYLRNPEYIQEKNLQFLRQLLPKSIKRASCIFSVSDFTKQELKHFFQPKAPITITPIPPLVDPRIGLSLPARLLDLGITSKKYLLFFGTIEPRKNVATLLDAYNKLPKRIQDAYSLVLAGGKGWRDTTILSSLDELQKNGKQVITTGYVSDEEKVALYRHAICLVLPSVYEGFGMPIVESLTLSTPVIASDIPVFHEVAKDAITYFDPLDSTHLAKAIENFLQQPRTSNTKSYSKALSAYSWGAVAATAMKAVVETTKLKS